MNTSKDTRSESLWLPPRVAAEYLGVSLGTLRNWTSARYIPYAKRGRVVRYHQASLDKWLAAGSCPGRTTIANMSKLPQGG
jgi:excisionase family DNA binding protein